MWKNKKAEELTVKINDMTIKIENQEKAIQRLESVNESLKDEFSNRLKILSDELYQYIAGQNEQLKNEDLRLNKEISGRLNVLSDELYQFISDQNHQLRDEVLKLNNELWMRTFGFDNMISELQLAIIEREFPGNKSKIEALKDSHKNERCFIIGNGPSLTAKDLDTLKKNRVFCFASKGIFHIFDKTDWRPDVWGASDLGHIVSNQEQISAMNGMIKLLCAQAYLNHGLRIKDAIFFPFIQAERHPPFFNQDVIKGVHFWGTITCKLINFAVYMGFKEIYLLGVDNQYGIKKDENGKYLFDINAKNHFSDGYLTDGEKKECEETIDNMIEVLEYVNLSFSSVKWYCDRLGVQVFNATRGGKLEIFPRISFEKATNIPN